MTLKTTGGKVAYWIIAWTVIVATLVLSIIYSASTHMKGVIFATDTDGRVYTVDNKGSCGKHPNDVWYLYDENGEQTVQAGPLLSNQYKFIRIKFNHNHYDKKTRASTLGSYKSIYHRILEKDGFYLRDNTDDNGFLVYEELDSGFKGVRCFSLILWVILTTVLITLPFVHTSPSKDVLLALMKYASYVEEDDKILFRHNDGKLQVDLQVTSKEVCFSEVYYKEDRIAHDIYILSDGTLKNVCTCEFYWIKRAIKSILPAFKNKMINTKLEHIL